MRRGDRPPGDARTPPCSLTETSRFW
jgi:hypothetical protein